MRQGYREVGRDTGREEGIWGGRDRGRKEGIEGGRKGHRA